MWGRLDMTSITFSHVVYRRIRTIYRPETSRFYTQRNAGRLCNRSRVKHCLCSPRTRRFCVALARNNFRKDGQFLRAITIARRGCHGLRATALFTIKKNRNRQGGSNPFTRSIASVGRYFGACHRSGSQRSLGTPQSFSLERIERRQTVITSATHGSSEKTRGIMIELINKVKHGCLMCSMARVMDDTSTLLKKYAAIAVIRGSRMTHNGKGACTDARC